MTTRKILSNFISLSAGETVGKSLAFVRVIYLSRLLGVELFGTLEFASTILLYFVLFIDIGLGILGTREIARDINNVKKYVSNIITIKLLIAFFAYLLIIFIAIFIPKTVETKKAILIYCLILFPSSLSTVWVFLGLERMKTLALVTIIFHMFLTVLVIIFIRDRDDVLRVPIIQLACDITISLFLMTIYIKQFGFAKLQIDLKFWKNMVRQSLPIGLSQIFGTISINLDVIMIGIIMEEKFVGWYSAGNKIIVLIAAFITTYQWALFPLMSKLYMSGIEETRNLLSKSIRFCAIIGIPIGFGGMVLANPIVNLAYGEQYINAIIPLQILIWSTPIILLRSNFRSTLIGLNKQMADLKMIGLGALVNVILNLFLIPLYGMMGAAVATIFAESIILCLGYFYVKKLVIQCHIFKHLVKPTISSIIMFLCLIKLAKPGLFMKLSVGIGIYFLVLVLLRGIPFKDIQRLYKGT